MKVTPVTRLLWCLVYSSLLASWPAVCLAGPKVVLGRNVPANQLVSMDQIDHSVWDGLLKRYVDDNGQVAYAQWTLSAPR